MGPNTGLTILGGAMYARRCRLGIISALLLALSTRIAAYETITITVLEGERQVFHGLGTSVDAWGRFNSLPDWSKDEVSEAVWGRDGLNFQMLCMWGGTSRDAGAMAGSLRPMKCVLGLLESDNGLNFRLWGDSVTLSGYGATFRMRKADYQNPAKYDWLEWWHAISVNE